MIEMIDIKKRYINSDKNIIDGCTATFDIGKRYALFGDLEKTAVERLHL